MIDNENTARKKIFEEALNLLSVKSKWIRSNWASRSDGTPVDITSPQAICFCLGGAVNRAAFNMCGISVFTDNNCEYEIRRSCFESLDKLHAFPNTPLFNDNVKTKHTDVINILKEAIKIEKGE